MTTERDLVKFAANALAVVAMIAVVGLLAVVVVIPRVVGGASLTVLTGSMSPEIPAGSIVVVEPVEPRTLKVGDVITWQVRPNEAIYVTHRIIEINTDGEQLSFVTQGDANSAPDLASVPAGAVRGRVMIDIPFVGSVLDAMKSPAITTLLLAAGGLAIAVAVVRSLLSMRGGNREGAPEVASGAWAASSERSASSTSASTASATATPSHPDTTDDGHSPSSSESVKGVANVS